MKNFVGTLCFLCLTIPGFSEACETTAAGASSPQPEFVLSEKVKMWIEKLTIPEVTLQTNPDAIVHVEIAIRQPKNPNIIPYPAQDQDSKEYKWWREWLDREFSPEMAAGYTRGIMVFDAYYGEVLRRLELLGLEVLKPESHSISFGAYGVKGAWSVLAKAITEEERLVTWTSPNDRPPQFAKGALDPKDKPTN